MTDRVLVLDFGSQTTQLIVRRVRESGVYCEIRPFNVSDDEITGFAPRAIVLSGGPASVTGIGTPRAPDAVFELGDLANAEAHLEVLDKACFFGCSEYTELKEEIEAYKAGHGG